MLDSEPCFNNSTRETKVEKFITHRSWRKYTAGLQGPYGEIKAEYRDTGPKAHAFTRVCRWSALGFQIQFKPKELVSDKPHGCLIEGISIRVRCWETGETVGKLCQKLVFACDSVGRSLGHGLK